MKEKLNKEEISVENVCELAQWIGANGDDEAAMSHRVYKDTECGAWLSFYKGARTTVTSVATWDVDLADSEQGILCVAGKDTTADYIVSPEDFPYQLQIFLEMSRGEDGKHYVCKGDPDVRSMAQIPETDRVQRLPDTNTWRIEFETYKIVEASDTVIGVQVGSIVEGASVDTEVHTLLFPFTLAEYEAAIADVEAEADAIWNATHGGNEEN